MNKKQITRIIFQTILVMITTFTILEFYQFDTIPYIVKWIVTNALIIINAVFHHWCGLKNGIDIMRESREEDFGKIVDITIEEKTDIER